MTDKRQEQPKEQGLGATFIQCGGADCEHEFSGWREFDDGLGGEQFCSKCGTGAMQWSMRYLP